MPNTKQKTSKGATHPIPTPDTPHIRNPNFVTDIKHAHVLFSVIEITIGKLILMATTDGKHFTNKCGIVAAASVVADIGRK